MAKNWQRLTETKAMSTEGAVKKIDAAERMGKVWAERNPCQTEKKKIKTIKQFQNKN